MANTIKIKRRTSGTDAPTTSHFEKGELAFVEATQKLFYRDNSDNIRTVGGEGSFLRSDTNDTMQGNLTITGTLAVNGTTTTINSSTLTVDDGLVHYGDGNDTDSVDLGFFGEYKSGGASKFAGLVRDASDSGKFILFTDNQEQPNTTVNVSGTGHTTATLKANIEGNLAGSPTITAPTIATSLDMNGTELILDVDADTSITADTNDRIDVKVGGSDRIRISSTTILPATNNTMTLGSSDAKFNAVTATTGNFTSGNFTNIVASSQIESSLSTGTSPFSVSSNTVNTNLNADLLDGQHAPSGDIVGTSDTQTLTSKTLTSPVLTTPQINDTSANHQYVFAVSELTADRTVTLPLLGAGDTFVFANHAQTLDNKTIDGGTF